MKLTTPVEIAPADFSLNYKESGLIIGSCFAINMGERMERGKMNTRLNPLGIMYNPLSVRQCFDILYSDRIFSNKDLYFHNGLWHSFAHHGSFSGIDPDQACRNINHALNISRKTLESLGYIIITLGTAWIYERNGKAVANCHKLPALEFTRRRMTVEETVKALEPIIRRNPAVKVILTVSPVRHIKDGLQENNVSKAILRIACEELRARNQNTYYFPSLEIMNDELRDYRFYADDMLHPSPVAIEYIWEKFSYLAIDEPTRNLIGRQEKLLSAMQHRPLHPESSEYTGFRASMLRQAQNLAAEYKDVDFSEELRFFA